MKPDQPTLLSTQDPHSSEFRGEQEVAYSADPFGNWIYLDSSWLELTGHTAQESLSRPMADFVHPEDRARHLEAFQSLLRGEIYSSRHPARLLRNDPVQWHRRGRLDDDDPVKDQVTQPQRPP